MKTAVGRFVGALALAVVSFALPARADEELSFGVGKVSTFDFGGSSAVVVGVEGLTEGAFSDVDSFGAPCFADDRIIDAEKADGDGDDNWWCGPITDLNLIYMTGWAKAAGLTAKYATVDDAVDYFRTKPKLLRYATTPGDPSTVTEGTYGYDGIFKWFKASTKTDLSAYTKSGSLGTGFASTLQTLLGRGEYVMQLSPLFFYPDTNARWADMIVSHSVTCCGYALDPTLDVTNPAALTGLFIIDSDNDQSAATDGSDAPNSIVYCPVSWDGDENAFVIDNIWGCQSYIYANDSYKALKAGNSDSETEVKSHTLTVKNGYICAYDEESGEEQQVKSLKVYPGKSVLVDFDYTKIYDEKTGEEKGEFQGWAVSDGTFDFGDDFVATHQSVTIVMPNRDVTLTGTYVTSVAAYFAFDANSVGEGDSASFYWSLDGGKSKYACDGATSVPVAAGTQTVSFYAIDDETDATSSAWCVPANRTIKVKALKKYVEDGETCYEEPESLAEDEWFVAADGARSIAFNANGGKCSVASRWYLDGSAGGTYYSLPTPEARTGYAFDGWDIFAKPKTGDTSGVVHVDDAVDFSVFGSKSPTLYARWLKTYTLTLKGPSGVELSASTEEEESEKSLSVLEGSSVSLSAQNTYTDAKDVEYVFQRWTPSKAYDFGEEYTVDSPWTTICMPAANLTMTATYLKESEAAYLTMTAIGDAGELEIEAVPEKQFFWSPDGTTWYPSGRQAVVKKGSYAIRWKSTSDVWEAPSAKTAVTLGAGDEYWNGDDPAVFTFVTKASVAAVVYEDGEWCESTAGGTATMNPADGRLPSGKSITLTAKANKGYVFAGWQLEQNWESGFSPWSTEAKYAISYLPTWYLDEEDCKVHYHAVFRPTSDYREENMENLFTSVYGRCGSFSPAYDGDPLSGTVELPAAKGCLAEFYFDGIRDLCRPATYRVVGKLPAGFKFDAKTCRLYGTPTAVGKTTFAVTVTDPANHTSTLNVTLNVRAVDADIAGDYRALLTESETGVPAGLLELSVTSAGKMSAKLTTMTGGTFSLTPSLVWNASADDPEAGAGTFSAEFSKESGNCSSGNYSSEWLYVSFADGQVSYDKASAKGGEEKCDTYYGSILRADTSRYEDDGFAAAFFGKYYTASLAAGAPETASESCRVPSELMASGYLTLTTDKRGAVKVAGKLADGEKVSASTVLLPSDDGASASAILLLVPSSYKKKGAVALQLEFTAEGLVTTSLGSWMTPPLLDAISGHDPDDAGDGELFLPGQLTLTAEGAVYSALADLTDYYLSLAVSTLDSHPTLEYSYADSDTKTKCYDYADLALSGYELDSGMLTGGRGGRITVGRSASPWKDSDGGWNYEETKNGDAITNPGGLTISYKSATGVFSGKFNLFFDYETTKIVHKSVSCAYEGVLIRSADELVPTRGIGSAVYSGKYTYEYLPAGKTKTATKTYTLKFALPVDWTLGE